MTMGMVFSTITCIVNGLACRVPKKMTLGGEAVACHQPAHDPPLPPPKKNTPIDNTEIKVLITVQAGAESVKVGHRTYVQRHLD